MAENMVFRGRFPKLHPSDSECISRSCSAWKCVGDQKGGMDKESIKNRPPATHGGEDYTVHRLDQADQEIERMFGNGR